VPKPVKEAAEIHVRHGALRQPIGDGRSEGGTGILEPVKVVEDEWASRKDRFCLDASKLNALTVKDAYPLPSVDGILSRIDQTLYLQCGSQV